VSGAPLLVFVGIAAVLLTFGLGFAFLGYLIELARWHGVGQRPRFVEVARDYFDA
jgi:hypothetical protein